jgi:hypothetical protein
MKIATISHNLKQRVTTFNLSDDYKNFDNTTKLDVLNNMLAGLQEEICKQIEILVKE